MFRELLSKPQFNRDRKIKFHAEPNAICSLFSLSIHTLNSIGTVQQYPVLIDSWIFMNSTCHHQTSLLFPTQSSAMNKVGCLRGNRWILTLGFDFTHPWAFQGKNARRCIERKKKPSFSLNMSAFLHVLLSVQPSRCMFVVPDPVWPVERTLLTVIHRFSAG